MVIGSIYKSYFQTLVRFYVLLQTKFETNTQKSQEQWIKKETNAVCLLSIDDVLF